jgi:hypothetical protein
VLKLQRCYKMFFIIDLTDSQIRVYYFSFLSLNQKNILCTSGSVSNRANCLLSMLQLNFYKEENYFVHSRKVYPQISLNLKIESVKFKFLSFCLSVSQFFSVSSVSLSLCLSVSQSLCLSVSLSLCL